MSQVPELPESIDSLVAQLKDLLGSPFVDWALAVGNAPLTARQEEVASALLRACLNAGAVNRYVPARVLISDLVRNSPTADVVNDLRVYAGGSPSQLPEPTGDAVLDALVGLAFETFGELLLLEDFPGMSITSFMSHQGRKASDAIRADPDLPFDATSSEMNSIPLYQSTGVGGSLQLCAVAGSILGAAFDTVRFTGSDISLEAIVERLPHTLAETRQAYKGGKATTFGVASLTGVLLPPEAELRFSWGRLRSARKFDHPLWMRRSLADERAMRTLDDGSKVAISDAGDVILETEVPYGVRINEAFDHPTCLSSTRQLEKRITQVRLAHILASAERRPPVVIPVWRRFVELLTQGGAIGLSDLQHFASRTPTQLSVCEAEDWRNWIELLDQTALDRMGPAPLRLLRACAERRDPTDSLVDAVIAWEALFGADMEATFRVSGGLAKLLAPASKERTTLRKRAAEIYRLRSKVVHGVDIDPHDIAAASQDAIELGVRAIRVIVADRPELVSMTSAERSMRLLME